MTTRRFLILFSYVLAVFSTLVLALLLARIPLTELIATRVLESAGLAPATIDIQQIGTKQLALTSLDISRTDDTGTSRFDAQDILVDYSPTQLAEGRVHRIRIERLVLHHESAAATASQPPDYAALLQLLNTDWRGQVFFNSLIVDQIKLEGSGFGPLQQTSHRLSINNTSDTIESRLVLLAGQSQNRMLRATHDGGSLAIELGLADEPAQSVLHAKLKAGMNGMNVQWQLQPNRLQSWLSPFFSVADIGSDDSVSGALDIDLATSDLIKARLHAETRNYHFAGYSLRRPEINLLIHANAATPERQLDIKRGSYVRIAGLESDDLTVGNSTLKLQATYTKPDDQWKVDGKSDLARLSVHYTDYTFVLKDISSRIRADADAVSIHSSFSPESLPGSFVVDISHSLRSGAGNAELRMPQAIDLDAQNTQFSQLLAAWPFAFDLASGTLRLDGDAAWGGGALNKLHADIQLANIGGHYNELLFSGLNYRQALDLMPTYRSPRSGKLSVAHIDAGVAIDKLVARTRIGSSEYGGLPKLYVNGLSGHVFDGEFSAEPFAYDLNTPANALTLHVQGIDLAEVVATQQFPDIEVSGRIDGRLPIEINPYGVFVNNGQLHNATSEGLIRYRPAATGGLEQNPLADIALKALSDFHYDTLKAHADYVPDGTLTLNFELNGTSPPLQTTRPVHLNINTEQNLISLLKSIRYVDGLNQGLDEQVQKMYQRKSGN